MTIEATLLFVVLAMLLGVVGQGARTVVGIKKAMDEAKATEKTSWFDSQRLVLSIFIGLIAGGLAGLGFATGTLTSETMLSREILIAIFAAGYAGTDFIEGFMRSRVPDTARQEDKSPNPAVQTR